MGKQIVNIPSFVVRVDSERHIDFALTSPFGGGRPGRVKRRSEKYTLHRLYDVTALECLICVRSKGGGEQDDDGDN